MDPWLCLAGAIDDSSIHAQTPAREGAEQHDEGLWEGAGSRCRREVLRPSV